MEIAGWRLYYGDGTTLDSRESSWEDAPAENVQVLIRFHERLDKRGRPLREMYHGSPGNAGDYYWQFGAGTAAEVPEDADVKYGRMIDDTEFMAIYNRALGDYQW